MTPPPLGMLPFLYMTSATGEAQLMEATGRYSPGQHPNSIANLCPQPREPRYDEPKRKHTLHLCDGTWEGIRDLAAYYEISVSEMTERLFREVLLRGKTPNPINEIMDRVLAAEYP